MAADTLRQELADVAIRSDDMPGQTGLLVHCCQRGIPCGACEIVRLRSALLAAEQEQERLKAELAEANTIRACNLQAAQRFKGEIRALREYVQHKPDCACVSHRRSDDGGVTFKFPAVDCTCGLSGLLQGPACKDEALT